MVDPPVSWSGPSRAAIQERVRLAGIEFRMYPESDSHAGKNRRPPVRRSDRYRPAAGGAVMIWSRAGRSPCGGCMMNRAGPAGVLVMVEESDRLVRADDAV